MVETFFSTPVDVLLAFVPFIVIGGYLSAFISEVHTDELELAKKAAAKKEARATATLNTKTVAAH